MERKCNIQECQNPQTRKGSGVLCFNMKTHASCLMKRRVKLDLKKIYQEFITCCKLPVDKNYILLKQK